MSQIHHHTPTLSVHESRGLAVRQVAYYRAEPAAPAQARITASVYNLSGRAIASWNPRLFGMAGQTLESWDSRGFHWRTDYDALLRPVLRREQIVGQVSRIAESFSYAGMSAEEARHNRCGRLIRLDDSAGSQRLSDYDASGKRVRKVTNRQAHVSAHRSEVRYLPDLEIRTDNAEGKPQGIANDQAQAGGAAGRH